jgi:hypothetical protein
MTEVIKRIKRIRHIFCATATLNERTDSP